MTITHDELNLIVQLLPFLPRPQTFKLVYCSLRLASYWNAFWFDVCSGIQDRLDHFEYLGVEAVWLSPIYRSPMVDFGYDVSHYTEVDPAFDTMADFESFIAAAQRKGL